MNHPADKPTKAEKKKSSPFRVITTPEGSRIGELLKESPAKAPELRLEDGNVVTIPMGTRSVPVADPSLLPAIPYEPVVTDNPSEDLLALVEAVRSELQNPGERRAWAMPLAVTDLPDNREVDELIRHRYDQYRVAIVSTLQSFLDRQITNGDQRALLSCLETDAPGDVRRAAMQVAARHSVAAAIPLVCGAAIHRTQRQLAVEAMRALQTLAPERLPLVHTEAVEDVRAESTTAAASSLLEWDLVKAMCDDTAPGAETLTRLADEAIDWTRVMHLAFGQSLAHQKRLLDRLRPDDRAGRAIRSTVADLLAVLGGRESPTTYEAVLRMSSARLILADPHAGADRETRQSAARLQIRDTEGSQLEEVFLALPDQNASLLMRTALGNPRSQAAKRLLGRAAEERTDIGQQLAPQLLELLRAHELEGPPHAAALVLLLESGDGRDRAADLAARELGRLDPHWNSVLAKAFARSRTLPNMRLVGSEGRLSLLSVLDTVHPDRAAALLGGLGLPVASDQAGAEALCLRLPVSWPASSLTLRNTIVPWIPVFASVGPAAPEHRSVVEAAALEAAGAWTQWNRDTRESALRLIGSVPPAEALNYLARVVVTLPVASAERREVLGVALELHLPRDPESVAVLMEALPAEEVLRGMIQEAATLRERIDDARRIQGASQRSETIELARDLRAASARAIQAIGREDQLGVLLARLETILGEHVHSMSTQGDTVVDEYKAAHERTAEPGQRTPALQAALCGSTARGSGTPSSIAFFRGEVRRLLESMSAEEISGFASESRRILDRIDIAASELIAAALIMVGGSIEEAAQMLSGTRRAGAAINVALALAPGNMPAALSLLSLAEVRPPEIAAVLAQLRLELQETTTSSNSHDPLSGLVRDMADTFDALDGLLIHVARLRRLMAQHGLMTVESELGAIHPFEALHPSRHRVMGRSAEEGPHEVVSLGFRRGDTGDVLAPATVIRLSGQDTPAS